MPDSQALILPWFVRYHTGSSEEGVNLAFAFMVVHADPQEGAESDELTELSGFVFCNDPRNDAGLSPGMNYKPKVGRGGPGIPGSWSDFSSDSNYDEGGQE